MKTDVLPDQLMNSILGYLYNILTNGDDVAPKSEDNYLAWVTPGIPFEVDDFDYMTEGLMGAHRKMNDVSQTSEAEEETKEETKEETDEPTKSEFDTNELLAQDVSRKYTQAENFARLVDMIPDTSGIAGDTTMNVWNQENTLSQAYYHVLKFSQVAEFEIDEKTKKKVEKLRGLLQTKKIEKDLITDEEIETIVASPLVIKYNEKMQNFLDAALEYNSHRIAALGGKDPQAVHNWAINAGALRNKVKAAKMDWETVGYKNEYEKIAAYISQITGRSMALLKAAYIDDFEKAKLTGLNSGSDFLYSTLIPGSFAKSAGWTKFSYNKHTYNSNYSYRRNKTTMSFRGGFFGWGARGRGSVEKIKSDYKMDAEGFKLSFEIAQVPIVRPWFNTNFLISKYWRFSKNNPEFRDDMLSDGGNPPGRGCMIPAIPTTCLFIRNLHLHFGKYHSKVASMYKSVSGSGGMSYGMFGWGGRASASHSSTKRDSNVNFGSESQGIHVPGLQLIGFKCHILPKSPNPRTGIKENQWI